MGVVDYAGQTRGHYQLGLGDMLSTVMFDSGGKVNLVNIRGDYLHHRTWSDVA